MFYYSFCITLVKVYSLLIIMSEMCRIEQPLEETRMSYNYIIMFHRYSCLENVAQFYFQFSTRKFRTGNVRLTRFTITLIILVKVQLHHESVYRSVLLNFFLWYPCCLRICFIGFHKLCFLFDFTSAILFFCCFGFLY